MLPEIEKWFFMVFYSLWKGLASSYRRISRISVSKTAEVVDLPIFSAFPGCDSEFLGQPWGPWLGFLIKDGRV